MSGRRGASASLARPLAAVASRALPRRVRRGVRGGERYRLQPGVRGQSAAIHRSAALALFRTLAAERSWRLRARR